MSMVRGVQSCLCTSLSRMFAALALCRFCGRIIILLSVIVSSSSLVAAREPAPFKSLYSDPKPFLKAIKRERRTPTLLPVTGISVPHHLIAADLIARGFQVAAGNHYDRIIIISPDHFRSSRRPLATTTRNIDTILGQITNDRMASATLLNAEALFDDADLFAKEHGIAALAPFVRHFFPEAKVVPIAVSVDATRSELDQAFILIKGLIGRHTLVVQSTDYSHYLRADIAQRRDQETLNVIAANDVEALQTLMQSDHLDSKASQYLQMRLQSEVYKGYATVVANRNAAEYGPIGSKTTSYIVTIYTKRPPSGADLQYPDQTITFFAGDTFIGRWFTAPLADRDIQKAVVRLVESVTGGAPLIVNLEGVLLDEPPEGTGETLHVMHASLAIPVLKALKVKAAGLANNHSFDLGAIGFDESRKILERSGIQPFGHKEIVDLGSFRLVGLNFIGKFDYRDYPVTDDNDFKELCQSRARPPLIALTHWGEEYRNTTQTDEYETAGAMEACGVSAIIGAHSHQASSRIEAIQGGEMQLTYSLGNFLFDQRADRSSGALLELRTFRQGTFATRLIQIPNLFDFGTEQLRHGPDRPR